MGRKMCPAEALRIKQMFLEGLTYKEIHQITGRSDGFLKRNFANFVAQGPAATVATLGHRSETYYTEKELLSLPPTYDYESLSEDEKTIFHGE